jgi:hypothetical protein
MVVVPYPAQSAPHYDQVSGTAWALGMFTLAIGRKPTYQDDAWVWSDVLHPDRLRTITLGEFERCTNEQSWRGGPPQAVPDCVFRLARTA